MTPEESQQLFGTPVFSSESFARVFETLGTLDESGIREAFDRMIVGDWAPTMTPAQIDLMVEAVAAAQIAHAQAVAAGRRVTTEDIGHFASEWMREKAE